VPRHQDRKEKDKISHFHQHTKKGQNLDRKNGNRNEEQW
jgi:hypothetical protein